jgi:succinyl-CoA synthetase beta subunit
VDIHTHTHTHTRIQIYHVQGGVTIEDIAHENPSAIIKEPIDISTGLKPGQVNLDVYGVNSLL